MLSFVHGEVAGRPWPEWVADDDGIASVARLVRRYDDTAQGFGLPPVPAPAVDPGPAGMAASTMGPQRSSGILTSSRKTWSSGTAKLGR